MPKQNLNHLTAETQIDPEVGFRYRTVCVRNEHSTLHDHDYYEIFLTLSDKVMHDINGVQEILPRGTLVFIRKEDVHVYQYAPSQKGSFVNIAFTEEILNELFDFLSEGFPSKKLLSMPQPPKVQLSESDINWMLKQLQGLNSVPIGNIAQAKYYFRSLILKIFTRYFECFSISASTRSSIPEWLFDLNMQMQKKENFSQSTDHMVALSGRCRAHLGRQIKQYYGKTITDYVNDLRLNYFANCLRNSDAPITDICAECGFESFSWGNALFTKRFGMSPKEYRKSTR